MERRTAWLLSMLVGVVVGGASYVLLVSDVALSLALVLFYVIATRLMVRYDSRLDRTGRLSVGKWSGAFAGLITLAAFFGVSPTLPISTDLRLALGLLVIGVGATAFGLGAGMAFTVAERPTTD